MGGGLQQLVAYGAQDIYLTSNPQITFFKSVYRRYTNFAIETVEQDLSSTPSQGATVHATLSKNGDLINNIYLNSSTADITDGDALISEVEIEIGGTIIDTHYMEWNQIWAELTTPESKALGFKNMTGALSHGLNKTGTAGVGMVQIPLNFWFCQSPGLALPIIALQHDDVKLKIVLGSTTGVAGIKLYTDYIFLDTEERRKFATDSHEYLITQVQKQACVASTKQKLNFDHPVKEIIWTSAATNAYGTARITLNGADRFSDQEEEYFQLRQPYQYHTSIPGANIPMSDRPQLLTNQVNILGNVTPIGAVEASGDASGVGKFTIDAGTKVLNFMSAADPGLKIGDVLSISYPASVGDAATNENVITVITTIQSVTTAWTANDAVAKFVLRAEGITELADSVAGDGNVYLIARLQDPLSRCSQFAKKINVYSFSLNPEDHQPSGTCNFSKIDTAQLITNAALTTAENIYAVNYNILRIMSGMAGIAYSN